MAALAAPQMMRAMGKEPEVIHMIRGEGLPITSVPQLEADGCSRC